MFALAREIQRKKNATWRWHRAHLYIHIHKMHGKTERHHDETAFSNLK